MSKDKKKERKNILRAISFSSQISFTIVASVMIGVFLGKFLDDFFGTSPWLLLIFSLLGMIAAFRAIFALAKKNGEKNEGI